MPYYARDLLAQTSKPWDGPWGASDIIFGRSRPTRNPNVKPPAEVGKVRSWGIQLVPEGHVHGDPTPKDGITARDMTSVWLGPDGPEVGVSRAREASMNKQEKSTVVGLDFVGMNKGAVAVGAVTARDVSTYRAAKPQKIVRTSQRGVQKAQPTVTAVEDDSVDINAFHDLVDNRAEREWLKFMFTHEKNRLAAEATAERARMRAHPGPSIASATALGRERRARYANESLKRSGTNITSLGYRYRYGKVGEIGSVVDAPRNWHPGTLPPAENSIYHVDFEPSASPSQAAIDGLSLSVPPQRHPPAELGQTQTLDSRLALFRSQVGAPESATIRNRLPGQSTMVPKGSARAPIHDTVAGYGGGGARLGYRFDPTSVAPGAAANTGALSLAGTVTHKGGKGGAHPAHIRRMPNSYVAPYKEAYTSTYLAPGGAPLQDHNYENLYLIRAELDGSGDHQAPAATELRRPTTPSGPPPIGLPLLDGSGRGQLLE